MTKLSKPVSREVTGIDGKPMIATLTTEGLHLREKGKRTRTTVPYALEPLGSGEREVATEISRVPIIVRLTAEGIVFREKRSPKQYVLPYGYAMLQSVRLEANRLREERDDKVKKVKRGLLSL